MRNLLDDEAGTFLVLVNEEGQHSLWPEGIAVPPGWNAVHRSDTRQNCLAYIKEHWIDMRPESLRRITLHQ
jgi:MbtH protein